MYKPTIIGLFIVLVLIIVYQFYKISEGFDDAAPSVATAAPSVATAAPPVATAAPPVATAAPSVATAAPSVATAPPPVVPAVAPAAQPTATLVDQATAPTSAEAAISKEKQDKAALLRDIQEIVRTELLQQQKLTTASSQPVLRAGADGNILMSPAAVQGQELSTARDKFCPKNMNEYIRKDSIPCWNCTLDY